MIRKLNTKNHFSTNFFEHVNFYFNFSSVFPRSKTIGPLIQQKFSMFRDDQYSIHFSKIRFPFGKWFAIVFGVSINVYSRWSIEFEISARHRRKKTNNNATMNKQKIFNLHLSTPMAHTFVIELVRCGIAHRWNKMTNFTQFVWIVIKAWMSTITWCYDLHTLC